MLSGLALALAARGLRISVITSQQRYDAPAVRLPARETLDGVEVYRVPTSRFGRSHLWGRAVDYLTFYVFAGWRLWCLSAQRHHCRENRSAHVVAAGRADRAHAPRPPHQLAAGLVPRGRRSAEPRRRSGARRLRAATLARDRSLRSADMNVVLGDLMADKLVHLGVRPSRIRLIPNWADGDLIRPIDSTTNALRREWGLGETFVVGYSGNLGRPHDIETMLEAIAVTEPERQPSSPDHRRAVRWLFIGDGALFGPLKAALARQKLANVTLKPYQPPERLAQSLAAIDVHLVSLRPEHRGTDRSEQVLWHHRRGAPTIFIGDLDGEIARLLRKHECGLTVAQGDGAGLTRAVSVAANPTLARSMGERARRAFDVEFNKTLAVARWEKLLREVARLSQVDQSALPTCPEPTL